MKTQTANDTLAADIREANLQASAWKYFPPEPVEPRRPFSLWAFAVIFIAAVVMIELARAI